MHQAGKEQETPILHIEGSSLHAGFGGRVLAKSICDRIPRYRKSANRAEQDAAWNGDPRHLVSSTLYFVIHELEVRLK
jgi:hypothetical protein